MNMLKRSLAMLLVLTMLFSFVPFSVFADDGESVETTAVTEAVEQRSGGPGNSDFGHSQGNGKDKHKDPLKETEAPEVTEAPTETTVPETTVPETTVPETTVPETTVPETTVPETTVPETTVPETTVPETTVPETTQETVPAEGLYALNTLDLEAEIATVADVDVQYRVLHLDNGRKYFSAAWIKALINEMAAAGYNQLQLAFGNDGLRFLLNDMSVTVNGTTYSSEAVTAGIQAGNNAYNASVIYAPSVNALTQAEMDDIIAHANSKGVAIVPHMNMPGHMDAILDAIEYVGISNAHFIGSTTSVRSLNLNNADAVAFAKALLQKYVDYFASKGCDFFHIGADEFANDAYGGSMGFPSMGADLYAKFAAFVNDCAAIVKGKGMTPRAWNDGISYGEGNANSTTNYSAAFDTGIQVTYWSSGWGSGYAVAPASTLHSKGHQMINTNGDYYFILNSNGITNPSGTALNFNNTSFMGSTIADPIGSMFCIWCDSPGIATEQETAAAARITLRKMAAAMKNSTSYSEEVVSGGFNADGTIAEDCNNVTVKDETSKVEVTGCDLTRVEVVVADAPVIADTANVLAWDITPYAGEAKYEGGATVKLPVPADWNTSLVKGFYVDNGQAVVVEESTCADGFCSFTMPHFSVGGLMLLDASTAYDQLIELNVGKSETVLIEGVDLTGNTYTPAPEGIASVSVKGNSAVTGTTIATTKATTLENGATYILRVYETNYALSNETGRRDWNTETLSFESNALTANSSHFWTLEASGTGYKLKNANGYLNLGTGNNTAYLNDTGEVFTITNTDTGWTIGNQNGIYINALGGLTNYYTAGGWTGDGTRFDLYKVTEATDASTTVTFTGDAAGETFVTINDVTYKIIVHGTVPITIKYQTENGAVIKTETVTVADNATTYAVSNFNHNGKFYTVGNTTLNIDPTTVTEYTITVTEVEEDLSQVASLSIEYWQTNAQAEEVRDSAVTSKTITAASAYSEEGIDLSSIIPVNTYKVGSAASDPALGYWRSRALVLSTNEQTGADGDDESLNGTGFTKVRYWNGSWAVYTEAGEWMNITLADYQLVAYYMNDMHLADEVSVNTSDWGKKGNGEFAGSYLGSNNVSLAFQVIYEGGTKFPANTGVELAPYTYFVDAWGWDTGNVSRGVGTVGINQIGDYQIWKITAETGEHDITHNGQYNAVAVNGFTWDNNEMTVWEDSKNPVSSYTILNPSGNPNTEGYYDNLRWNEVNESILIRIYIKAVETDDSLKVVYYDEKFGDTLVEYNVIVPYGSNFNNGIVIADTKTPATLPEFSGNANRKDATGYGIVNALDKTQNFRTDLTQVPEAVGKYRNELYTYTGSVVSSDGTTITHYYTINTEVLSPNFVADFGLPLSFPLTQVIGENQETLVNSVTVNEKTRYGTLSYNDATKTFTYTPTEILPNIDVLTINILFAGAASATTTNVGVTPATSVYYEESFLLGTGATGWTTTSASLGTQETAVLGARQNEGSTINHYGYDGAYANAGTSTGYITGTKGASTSFTFTGTGFQLYGNSNSSSGYVTVMSNGGVNKMYMINTELNGVEGGAASDDQQTDAAANKTYYGLPFISETALPFGTYTVQIKQTNGENPIYLDGVRILNTINDTTEGKDNIYYNDKEDRPEFYELRDAVLNVLCVNDKTVYDESIYNIKKKNSDEIAYAVENMVGQVYNKTNGAVAMITDESVTYGEDYAQDLLDNGPKNELYLYKGQTLTFKVATERIVQIGLKAPTGSATYTLNGSPETLNTSVDMFYEMGTANDGKTFEIKNTGDNVLSVTLLKICDDPNAAFLPLTQTDIENVLMNIVNTSDEEETPVNPSEPVKPETPTEPSKPVEPTEPEKPTEPEVEETKPTKPGKPEKPAKPGQNKPGKPAEKQKDAKLKITYVNLMGKKVGSATLTETGAANQRCTFSVSEIFANAPAGRNALWFLPVVVPYGSNVSIIVPVI